MKIKSITPIENEPVFDISVENAHHFLLENGVAAHNSMYPREIVSGGTGIMLSADDVWVIGKSQNKNDRELLGFDFKIKIEKSRYVKEKSIIPITVSFDAGIEKTSGLFDVALELGYVSEAKKGFYNRRKLDPATGEMALLDEKNYRRAEAEKPEFWVGILDNPYFAEAIRQRYQLGGSGEIL